MSKRTVAILFTVITLPFISIAQVSQKVQVQAFAGTGISYGRDQNIHKIFMPVIRPNASLLLSVPLGNKLALSTGAGYFLKGYNTYDGENYGDAKFDYTTEIRLHYLSIPLMASFKAYTNAKSVVWLDGGMNYNFFLTGELSYDYANYKQDVLVEKDAYTYQISGKLGPSKYSSTAKTYDVTGLDVALKMQVRYMWKNKYTFSVYHEQSLYDVRVKTDGPPSSLKLRYTGLSIGYVLF